jgi:AcrR family transcriptional regulator
MSPEELEARTRILQTTLELLNEVEDPTHITIRQIAQRAGVGVGLINYHFQSRENLFQQAVAYVAGSIDEQWSQTLDKTLADPRERLKKLLKDNAKVAVQNQKFARILIMHELLESDFSVPQIILPVLREIYGAAKSEPELRSLAFALVISLQVAFVRERAFRKYLQLNLTEDAERDAWIDSLVDQIVQ